MRISLLTVPVELDYTDLLPRVQSATDIFVSSIRADGQLPVMPKIAIVSLINWMKKNGFTSDQYDFFDVDMLMPNDEAIIDYIVKYKPDVVGLSAVVSTCYAQVKRLSNLIKRISPDTWIILGGSLTASSNLVLRKTNVDVCVVGDGEIAWIDFLNYVKTEGFVKNYDSLSKIQGLSFIDDKNKLVFTGYGLPIPGDENIFPDYEILKLGLKSNPAAFSNYFRIGVGSTHFQTDPRSNEIGRRPMLAQLWTSKGCVARCTFCQRSTKGNRVFNLERFDEHLKLLSNQFNVGFIHILDENFGSDNEYSREVAKILNDNNMLWMASGLRVSSVDYELIKYFKDHGCSSLKFGVESGSQKIMNVMEKKFTVERVFKTLSYCAELQIYSPLAVMVGMPGETNETAAVTGNFLGRLSYTSGVSPQYAGISIFYALPLTGTPLYVYGQQAGVIGKTPEEEEEYLLSVSGTGAGKINYVNLNGSHIKDVIWWDWLVQLEANRTYHSLVKKLGPPSTGHVQNIIINDKKREIIGRALSIKDVISSLTSLSLRGLKSKLFYLGDSIMERYIIPSSLILYIPRKVAYPILRELIYIQYRFQGVVLALAGRKFNLWKKWNSIEQISDSLQKKEGVDINLSLRRVVKLKSVGAYDETDAQDVLSIGL